MNEPTVAFYTLGCKLNQYETEAIRESFIKRGYRPVDFTESSDVYVINTCTVTTRSAARSRKLIRRARRRSPGSRVVVVGCYSEVQPGEVSRIEGVDLILGNTAKSRVVDYLENHQGPVCQITDDADKDSTFEEFDLESFGEHSRAFVKIQEGCDVFCSYCIIPYARNPVKSRTEDSVVQQVLKLESSGYREVVIAGTHLGLYGKDRAGGGSLVELLKRICRETAIERIRLSSLEPMDMSEELLRFIQSEPRICHHLHLPIQSGDDEILTLMRRPYSVAEVRDIFTRLADALPDISLGTDVITGFPGETNEHYANTYRLLESLPLAYIHVFPFSPRPGTPAADFSGGVHPEEKKRRVKELYNLRLAKLDAFRSRFFGQALPTLIECSRDKDSGNLVGITGNYLRILAEGDDSWMNRLVHMVPKEIRGEQLYGSIRKEISA